MDGASRLRRCDARPRVTRVPFTRLQFRQFPTIIFDVGDRTAIRQARHSGAFPRTHRGDPAGVGMPPRDLAAEDVASWLTPPEALMILNEAFGDASISK
jgi:hypothetical protein